MRKTVVTMWLCVVGMVLGAGEIGWAAPVGTVITYQGRLTDQGSAANGSYDFVFRLYDAFSGGNLLGTDTAPNVTPQDGYFKAELDFGSGVFAGEARWLEIRVAPAGSGSYTPLIPRQEMTPTPYALYALNAPGGSGFWTDSGNDIYNTNSGNVGIGTTTPTTKLEVAGDGKFMGGDISVWSGNKAVTLRQDGSDTYLANMANFVNNESESNGQLILNGEAGIQLRYGAALSAGTTALAVDTTGNVGIGMTTPNDKLDVNGNININSVYKIGGETVLSTSGFENILVGRGAGLNNTGRQETFVGHNAGYNNQGYENTFIGHFAGYSNATGTDNTFLGKSAGSYNTTGSGNTFLGRGSGLFHTEGYENTFVGHFSGLNTIGGYENTFVGSASGYSNTTGYDNTFLGHTAGVLNTTGNYNTFLGMGSGLTNTEGNENTFVGLSAGRSNATGNSNTGVGYRAGFSNSTGSRNVFLGYQAGYNETGSEKLYIANGANDNDVLIYGDFSTDRIGIGTTSPQAKLEVSGGETILEQEPWQTPTFQNGWSNYGGVYNPTQYFIDSTGVVHLRGLARGGTLGQPIFTLPAGYRPEFREMHTAMGNPNVLARVDVLANGEVVAQAGSNFFISLDGITFRAAN